MTDTKTKPAPKPQPAVAGERRTVARSGADSAHAGLTEETDTNAVIDRDAVADAAFAGMARAWTAGAGDPHDD